MRDPRLVQLERILESAGFAQSERLSRFLRYVVEETVAGRGGQLKESTIGVDVFGKPAGFDPKSDSTVRSEAVKLRSRLAAYYAATGAAGELVISIPKGAYVPEFAAAAAPPKEAPVVVVAKSNNWTITAVAAVTLALAAGGGYWALTRTSSPPRTGQPVRITYDRGVNTDPALSAEGKLLVYASTRSGEGHLDIWIRPVHSTGAVDPLRLSTNPANDSEPDISPQGDLVAYRSERNGGGIYVVSALGGSERLLAAGGRRPRFAPSGDGHRVVFYTGEPRLFRSAIADGKIFVADASGGEPPHQLAPKFRVAVSPVWSPDGKWILFQGYQGENYATIKMDWWLVAADGSGEPVQVGFNESVERNKTCGARTRAPMAWAGDFVLFETFCQGTRGIVRIALRGGKIRGAAEPVTLGAGSESAPAMTAGGLIAYVSNTSNTSIWSSAIGAPPGPPKRLIESEANDQYPSISDDGRTLAYVSSRSGNQDVWVKDLPSGRERLVAGGSGPQTYPELESDGAHVVYTTLEPDPKDIIGYNSIAWRKSLLDETPAVKVCEHCAYVGFRAPNGRILDIDGHPTYISLRDPAKRELPKLLWHPKFESLKPTPHPSGKWIAFNVMYDKGPTLEIAPFDAASSTEIPESKWIEAGAGYMPVWSRDGKTLFFGATHEGNDCIWALPFDSVAGRPSGTAVPFVHFHNPEELLDPGIDVYRWMSASRTHIVYPVSRFSSSIWILK